MSTRGLYGIRKNGVDKLTYNHWDSYPSSFGNDIIVFIKDNGYTKLSKMFDLIELVGDKEPTFEQIDNCLRANIVDISVAERTVGDWYCLTRKLQGNFPMYSQLTKDSQPIYMLKDNAFIKDSLFCEYAYIINLDDETLEFYIGFQKEPDENNRYGTECDDNGYYPCKLVRAFGFDEIASRSTRDIVNEMEEVAKNG